MQQAHQRLQRCGSGDVDSQYLVGSEAWAGPRTGEERESAFFLATAHPGSALFADGGFWGAEYQRTMELIDIRLITPERHKLGQRRPSEIAKARIRLVIESLSAASSADWPG